MTRVLIIGALLWLVAALLIVAVLAGSKPEDTPVEGVNGIDRSLGRDVHPGAGLYRSRAGQRYTGSHRRKGPSRWLARLGRTHRQRPVKEARRLP